MFYIPVKKKNTEKIVVEKIMKSATKFKIKPISVKKSVEKIEVSMLPETKEAELWVWQVRIMKNCFPPYSLQKQSFLVWYDTATKSCLVHSEEQMLSVLSHTVY